MAILSPLRQRRSALSPILPSNPQNRSKLARTATIKLREIEGLLPKIRGNDARKEAGSRVLTPEPWERIGRHREGLNETGARKGGKSQEAPLLRALKKPSPKPIPTRENGLTESFEAMMNLCESYRDSSRSPLLSRISGTERLIRKYGDVRNYIDYLPQSYGRRCPLSLITQYLDKHKLVWKSEIIDKETASDCASSFFKTSVLITKHFGKPKLWKHSGRVLPLKAETALLSYGNRS